MKDVSKDDEQFAKSLLGLTKRPKRSESVDLSQKINEICDTQPICAKNLFNINNSPISIIQKPIVLINNLSRKSSEIEVDKNSAFTKIDPKPLQYFSSPILNHYSLGSPLNIINKQLEDFT